MKQKVVGGLPKCVQNTPSAPGEILSATNNAPMAFNLNQSSAVCLPLLADSQSLIWVHSNEIDLQPEGVAELDKAFDHFPYLTVEQTAALAKRCSLLPDQVKLWFMVQRLRYGISWDYKDIHTVRWKLRGKKNEANKDRGEDEESKTGVTGGKKEQSANDGENEREQAAKKKEDTEVEEGNTEKKRKRMTVMEKMRKKKKKQEKESAEKRRSDETECEKYSQMETTCFTRKKKKAKKRLRLDEELAAHESCVVPDEPLDASPLLVPLSQSFDQLPPLADNQTEPLQGRVESATFSPMESATFPPMESAKRESETEAQLEEVETTNHNDAVPDVTHLEDAHVVDADTPPAWMHGCRTVTNQTQLAMMRSAFSRCQYPERENYDQLASVIDVPRYVLVRWWGDMHYYVKKVKPRWLTAEQHRRALATIRYRQYLKAVMKLQPQMVGSEEDSSQRCGEELTFLL